MVEQFEIGDNVKCVDANHSTLILNDHYQISGIGQDIGGSPTVHVKGKNRSYGCFSYRFRKIEKDDMNNTRPNDIQIDGKWLVYLNNGDKPLSFNGESFSKVDAKRVIKWLQQAVDYEPGWMPGPGDKYRIVGDPTQYMRLDYDQSEFGNYKDYRWTSVDLSNGKLVMSIGLGKVEPVEE